MGSEVAKVEEAEVVSFGNIESALLQPGVGIEDTPEDAARQMVQDILDAATPEELLGESEVVHARDMLDVPFVATSVRFLNSNYDGDGIAIYAIVEAVNDEGERFLMTCGARNVVAQFFTLMSRNWLPRRVRVVERGVARNGKNAPMRLIDATA